MLHARRYFGTELRCLATHPYNNRVNALGKSTSYDYLPSHLVKSLLSDIDHSLMSLENALAVAVESNVPLLAATGVIVSIVVVGGLVYVIYKTGKVHYHIMNVCH
ncbi:hypothetical protein BDR06DRAFT_795595 [Suillus hirtellus]|nr:hypothetical protein BDR06DRAFT_795595 [Suillus hirtellus]